jgi:prepilin-type N-terminal cleavage/methylation domain-containing protein
MPIHASVRTVHPSRARSGVTLLELVVTLALLAILAGVAGVSLNRAAPPPAVDASTARVLAARDQAVGSGHSVSITVVANGHAYAATALPDGRVIADPALGIDPLTGRAHGHAPDDDAR